MREMSGMSALVVNALIELKGFEISEDVLCMVGRRLTVEQKKKLLDEKELAPKWMWEYWELIATS